MTTDEQEGRRQAEAMQPVPFKVSDSVHLSGGVRPMKVIRLEDYGNMAVCQWTDEDGQECEDSFPVRSLVGVGTE